MLSAMGIENIITRPPHVPLIAPSILAADFADLGAQCAAAMQGGADLLHLDVMDGHFVPNLTMGPDVCRALRNALPDVCLDVHLMVTDPGRFIEPFARAGANHLTFHLEAEGEPAALADRIHRAGLSAGLAINPTTDATEIMPHIPRFELVLIMSVNPGYAGQKFIPEVLKKARAVSPKLRRDQRLEIDGGINAETAPSCRDAGCDVLVAASAVFGADDYREAIAALRGPAAVESRSA